MGKSQLLIKETDIFLSRLEPSMKRRRPSRNPQDLSTLIMTEGISKVHKILYINLNKRKYAMAWLVNMIPIIWKRFSLLPLLSFVNSKPNLMNMFYSICAVIYTFSFLSGDHLESSIRLVLPLVSFLLIFHAGADFTFQLFEDPKNHYVDMGGQLLVGSGSGKVMFQRSLFFMGVGLGFCFLINGASYVLSSLFVVREDPKSSFYQLSIENRKKDNTSDQKRDPSKTRIDIEYKSWAQMGLFPFEHLHKILVIAIDLLYISTLVVISFLSSSRISLLAAPAFFALTIFQKIIKSNGIGPKIALIKIITYFMFLRFIGM